MNREQRIEKAKKSLEWIKNNVCICGDGGTMNFTQAYHDIAAALVLPATPPHPMANERGYGPSEGGAYRFYPSANMLLAGIWTTSQESEHRYPNGPRLTPEAQARLLAENPLLFTGEIKDAKFTSHAMAPAETMAEYAKGPSTEGVRGQRGKQYSKTVWIYGRGAPEAWLEFKCCLVGMGLPREDEDLSQATIMTPAEVAEFCRTHPEPVEMKRKVGVWCARDPHPIPAPKVMPIERDVIHGDRLLHTSTGHLDYQFTDKIPGNWERADTDIHLPEPSKPGTPNFERDGWYHLEPLDYCIRRDGNQWVATYGSFRNLQESIAGFGNTPLEAFDALETHGTSPEPTDEAAKGIYEEWSETAEGQSTKYDEHQGRVYYQDIVYSVCCTIDRIIGGGRIVCGTYQSPTIDVQTEMHRIEGAYSAMASQLRQLRDEAAKLRAELEKSGQTVLGQTAEIKALQGRLAEAKKKSTEWEKAWADEAALTAKRNDELADAKAKLAAGIADRERLKAHVAHIESVLGGRQRRDEMAKLKAELAKANARLLKVADDAEGGGK